MWIVLGKSNAPSPPPPNNNNNKQTNNKQNNNKQTTNKTTTTKIPTETIIIIGIIKTRRCYTDVEWNCKYKQYVDSRTEKAESSKRKEKRKLLMLVLECEPRPSVCSIITTLECCIRECDSWHYRANKWQEECNDVLNSRKKIWQTMDTWSSRRQICFREGNERLLVSCIYDEGTSKCWAKDNIATDDRGKLI